jgi:hypothetical protein
MASVIDAYDLEDAVWNPIERGAKLKEEVVDASFFVEEWHNHGNKISLWFASGGACYRTHFGQLFILI